MNEKRLREILREELAMRDETSPAALLERDKISHDLLDLARRMEEEILDPEAEKLVHQLITVAEDVNVGGYQVDEIAPAYVNVSEEEFLLDPKQFMDQVQKGTQLLVEGELTVLCFTARIGQ